MQAPAQLRDDIALRRLQVPETREERRDRLSASQSSKVANLAPPLAAVPIKVELSPALASS